MTNSIPALAWHANHQQELVASTGTGQLTIKYIDYDEGDPAWRLTFTPYRQSLGEHADLQAALKAAEDFVGDSE